MTTGFSLKAVLRNPLLVPAVILLASVIFSAFILLSGTCLQNQSTTDLLFMNSLAKNAAASNGSSIAPVIILEFSDYQCPFCGRYINDTYFQIQSEYIETGKVQYFFKDFPLPGHSEAKPAAIAARCAGEQEKYWEMHNKLFEYNIAYYAAYEKNGELVSFSPDYAGFAVELGLNASEFDSCLGSGKFNTPIITNIEEVQIISEIAREKGKQFGAPFFLIGKRNSAGKLIIGAQSYPTFKTAIDAAIIQ